MKGRGREKCKEDKTGKFQGAGSGTNVTSLYLKL